MRIHMICGAAPPDPCGVGDYTALLTRELRASGATVETQVIRSTRFSDWVTAVQRLPRGNTCDVHLQYPGLGFGLGFRASPLPLMLAQLRPMVVTLHEYAQVHPLRRHAARLLCRRARRIVFTNAFERERFLIDEPGKADRCTVIPIGSNIPTAPLAGRRCPRIVHFGLLRPKKGIELVVELAEQIRQAGAPFEVAIAGATCPGQESYVDNLRTRSTGLPLRWIGALGERELAIFLAEAAFAYLPFPDGASERRTSLFAILANGVIPCTTRGPYTPTDWQDSMLFSSGPADALEQMLHCDGERNERMREAGKTVAARYEWPSIARSHLELYRSTT